MNADRTLAATRADAATSDAEGRAQAAEMITAAVIERLAETVTRLNASEDRALRLDRDLIEAKADLANAVRIGSAAIDDRDTNARELECFVSESEKVVAALGAGEDDSLPDVAARIVAERDAAIADRDAARHEHNMAIANRDGLAAERGRLRLELASMTIMRDRAHAHLAAISTSLGVESAGILATIERVRDDIKRKDREWSAMRDERDAVAAELDRLRSDLAAATESHRAMAILRDREHAELMAMRTERNALRTEADKLRARPVLTEDRLAEALHSLDLLHEPIRSVAAAKMMAKLGAVTLPAQDRAEELVTAMYHARAARLIKGYHPAPTTRSDLHGIYGVDVIGDVNVALASLDAPATTPGSGHLRPCVAAFAHAMEAELRKNDHKGGWKGCGNGMLMKRLREESDELTSATTVADRRGVGELAESVAASVISEAADVANFAMMIADNTGRLRAPATTPSKPADVVSIDGLVAVYVTEERLADVLAALPVWRGERMPWQYGGARMWAADLLTRLSGITVTPEAGK